MRERLLKSPIIGWDVDQLTGAVTIGLECGAGLIFAADAPLSEVVSALGEHDSWLYPRGVEHVVVET